jgi:hypothetical protein
VSDAAAVLFLAIGVGIPLLFCLLAGSKDPVRRARVRWQMMLFGASLALIAFVFDLVQAQVLWACVFGFAAIAFAAGAVVEMRLRTGLRGGKCPCDGVGAVGSSVGQRELRIGGSRRAVHPRYLDSVERQCDQDGQRRSEQPCGAEHVAINAWQIVCWLPTQSSDGAGGSPSEHVDWDGEVSQLSFSVKPVNSQSRSR